MATVQPEGQGWNLENKPTWAVATVATVFVISGLLIVFIIEKIEHRLKQAKREPLVHALKKMKEELMLLGFISLLLTVFQNYVASICIKNEKMQNWAPCRRDADLVDLDTSPSTPAAAGHRRRLLAPDSWPMVDWGNEPLFHGRVLSESTANVCKPGNAPFASVETQHQLHVFIFVLAFVHILYSLFAMLLASKKAHLWKKWEEEANLETHDSQQEVVKSLSLRRQTTFVKYYTSKPWSTNRLFVWINCFFRQFFASVLRSDYLSLRLGFITNHNFPRNYDFHSYMIRSLEDEYQRIAGISPLLWMFVIVYTLFNFAGTNLFFWLATVPAVLILIVGAKLQHVIATLALEHAGFSQRRGGSAATGLKPRDELFWFNKPTLILHLIHFILFQNAFEMATYLSFGWQFGFNSCFLENNGFVYSRIAIGAVVQSYCSYKTLPLYALVTQMGSHYNHSIFGEQVKNKIHPWRKGAKDRVKVGTSLDRIQEESTTDSERRGTDYPSPDDTPLETIENDTGVLRPHLEPVEHSVGYPQDVGLPTEEMSLGSGPSEAASQSPP